MRVYADIDLDDLDDATILQQAVRIAERYEDIREAPRTLARHLEALQKALRAPVLPPSIEDEDPLLPPPSTAARVSSVEEAKRLAVGAAQ